MRIGFVDESCCTKEAGGAEIWTMLLQQELRRRNIETQIFSYAMGIPTKIPEVIKNFPYIREGFVLPYIGYKLIPQLEKDFDVLFFSSITMPLLQRARTRTIIYANCLFSRQTKYFQQRLPLYFKPIFNTFSYNYFKTLEARSLKNVDRIVVPKLDVKRFMVEHLKIATDKIDIIPSGIDLTLFKPPASNAEREDIALFVGRGTIAKGFDTILAAADMIKGKIVAVAQRVSSGYQRQIRQKKNFQLIARMPHHELVKLYQKASVFILPSLTEGVPITTLEAMACGLPVVCSPEGGGETIQDGVNGFIVPYRDPVKLAERVNYVFRNKNLINDFGPQNIEIVKNNFNIIHNAGKMIDIFQHLIT